MAEHGKTGTDETGYRVVRLVAENVKRLTAVDITPGDASVVVLGGKNGAGKTSVLDALEMACGGAGSIPPEPIHRGAEKGRVVLDLGDIIVRRTFTANGGGQVIVENGEGMRFTSPQKILDALCGKIAFDPLSFANAKPADQLSALRDLTGVDTSDLDTERATMFAGRRDFNRKTKEKAALAAAMPTHDDAPAEPVDVSGLMDELRVVRAFNDENRGRRDAAAAAVSLADTAARELARAAKTLDASKRAIAAAELSHAQAKKARNEAANRAHDAGAAAVEAKKGAERPDRPVDAAESAIETVETVNANVRANQKRAAALDHLAERAKLADGMTGRIERVDEDRRARIESATMPIAGLGFGADGVTWQGLPFEQASDSERWRVSVAIGLAMNPKLRVILIRQGALLDDDSLAAVSEMAAAAGAQIWIEDVGDRRCSVLIEDGAVAGAADDAAGYPEYPAADFTPAGPSAIPTGETDPDLGGASG